MTEKLTTGCENIDGLIEGGLPRGLICGVDSMPNTGKSFLSYQCSVSCNKNFNQSALYIDTEGDFQVDMVKDKFDEIFSERFDVEPDVVVKDKMGLDKLTEYLGMRTEFKQSDASAKYDAKIWTDDLEQTPIYKDLKDGDFGIIVLDSMSAPFKEEIPEKSSNRPARATVQSMIFGRLKKLVNRFNTAGIVTHHTSSNPSLPYTDHGNAWGGRQISYNTKIQIKIIDGTNQQKKKYGENTKRFFLNRYPGKQEDMVFSVLKTDHGYDKP